ncbi:dipicolinate synthase subunit B [Thermicanus aegyptius]|uniref:dipicolinate synthase subunit B n=1 Tax=Thermicanus aegyptius TaxID=94009 RepID=UPI000427D46D|nr:dipicolinate synthase subunit B [Thermicanus aegyptius]
MKLEGKTIGFGLTGSHCTYDEVLPEMEKLVREGVRVIPVVTYTVANTDTRFGTSEDWLNQIRAITGEEILTTIPEAEPFGPGKTLDLMLIAPCTGNSISKLAHAMTDNAVLMAAKATMRNQRPVVVAISTNDGLGLNAANIAKLISSKLIYFVPFGQDAPTTKPQSLVAKMDLIKETCETALEGKQIQPVLIERWKR